MKEQFGSGKYRPESDESVPDNGGSLDDDGLVIHGDEPHAAYGGFAFASFLSELDLTGVIEDETQEAAEDQEKIDNLKLGPIGQEERFKTPRPIDWGKEGSWFADDDDEDDEGGLRVRVSVPKK